MRDVKAYTTDDNLIDIDVQDGDAVWLSIYEQSDGQRASLASIISKGSIPGMLDTGIQWSDYFTQGNTDGYVSIDNQMRNMISLYGKSQYESDNTSTYTPVAIINEDGTLSTQIIRSQS